MSTLAVPSTFGVSVRTQGHAVTCLNHLLQDPGNGFLEKLSNLRAAYRLGRAMQTILVCEGDAGVPPGLAGQGVYLALVEPPYFGLVAGSPASGKSKKKGPALGSDQVHALEAITGVLKILTVNAACAYRVARTGCLPSLLLLKDHSSLPLRRNCQMIVSNTAYLFENEPFLMQLELPEEYLTGHRLRLSETEADAVAIDFAEVHSKAAQIALKVHGHLFNLSIPEAQNVVAQAATVTAGPQRF